uniref:NADH-ubiquinone oxidoreductase chain 4L n=1 Tax=Alaysia sp. n. 2 MM-2023 TaxID=3065423 RepID=A0AA49K6J4_9ANNE|nr:NADH dehydrogenase subunit 4L [Alaysia sp. n. 2 MM-2023]
MAMTLHLMFPILVSSSLMTFILQRRHLLMALLALESTTLLTMIFAATIYGAPSQFNIIIILVIMTLAACEASLGLALMVIMTRSYGADTVKLLSINKC